MVQPFSSLHSSPGLVSRWWWHAVLLLLLLAGPAARAQAPTITSFAPAGGPVGSTITVTGTNLLGTTSASLNGVAGVLVGTPTATSVRFSFGAGAGSGPVSVTTPDGSASSSGSFTVLATPSGPCATPTLATSYVSNNSNKGEMFNIVAINTITVSCFDLNLILGSRGNYELYYKTGSYVGSENNPAAWTLLGSNPDVPCVGFDFPSPLGIPLSVTIPAGQTAAFYVTATNVANTTGIRYTNNTGYTTIADNADLRIESGIGKAYPFSTNFVNRSFNGTVHYTVGPPPTITSFTPTNGPVGTSVTVTGTNLSAATAVQVNGTAGTIVGTPTTTSLTFTVGAGSTTGAVSVVAPGGTATGSSFVVGSAPVLSTSGGPTTWVPAGGPVAVDAALTLSDTDSPSLSGATVRLTTNFQSGQDVLAFANANGISGTYVAGTGVLTLSGLASVANYQAALRSITYDNTAGSPNTASRTVSFEATDGYFSSPAATKTISISIPTATPALTAPTDGSSTNDTTPTYTGTAVSGSIVTVYVDNVALSGTVTATGGSWTKTQSPALAPGSHTVYATAQASGRSVSAPSATRTFTVDTTAPTVVITSAAGASGSSTGTTPVPFTITFSEPVTGLLISEVTVSGGTKSALTSVSSSEYTLNVTPTVAGSPITVSLAANRAQDAATNGNTAATAFTITYVLAPTITALSAAAELPGMPVTLTGTGFTAASTVSFGGVPATVTYNSGTSLTAVVPAGAAPGSSLVVVSTSGVGSLSAPAFTVLEVYAGTTSCLSTTAYTATGDGRWHYLRTPAGAVVAALHDTRAALGNVTVRFQATGSAGAVRQDGKGRRYLDRNFQLSASGGNAFPGQTINVRFYGLVSEMARLVAADNTASYATLKVTQYSGSNEDCELGNNDFATGEFRTLAAPASLPGSGIPWFGSTVAVADHFSEFFLTAAAAPLPVELLTFTAAARGAAVQLAWRTASETNSARFDIERSADGQRFEKIGEQQAQGRTASPTDYSFLDHKPTSLPAHHLTYYRLRQVDVDGTAAYSPVRAITVGGKGAPTVYPNPARSTLTMAGLAAGAAVTVCDALGRVVAAATADAGGTAQLTLPAGLTAGTYIVRSGAHVQRLTIE